MRVTTTERGVRLEDGDAVLSEVLRRPGPTHSVFDVLAAIVRVLVPAEGRVALLGFAGGGMVAPLRAMGWSGPLWSVDLEAVGERVFRELSGGWCGPVRCSRGEAGAWLRRRRRRFDLILDDLSITVGGTMTKPPVSYGPLPGIIARRLRPGGIGATNALPVPGVSWRRLLECLAGPWDAVRVVSFDEFENRIVIAGPELPPARGLSRQLRIVLRAIGSEMAAGISVRDPRRASANH